MGLEALLWLLVYLLVVCGIAYAIIWFFDPPHPFPKIVWAVAFLICLIVVLRFLGIFDGGLHLSRDLD
jgi:hypothetical protein